MQREAERGKPEKLSPDWFITVHWLTTQQVPVNNIFIRTKLPHTLPDTGTNIPINTQILLSAESLTDEIKNKTKNK